MGVSVAEVRRRCQIPTTTYFTWKEKSSSTGQY